MRRFVWRDGRIFARLDELDLAVLGAVPPILGSVGELGTDPAAGRLVPAVFRDDAARSAEFARLSSSIIDDGRQADLDAFKEGFEQMARGEGLTLQLAESCARVLTTARLVLGARLGIEMDGWEADPSLDLSDANVAALYVLGRLQESLVTALSAAL